VLLQGFEHRTASDIAHSDRLRDRGDHERRVADRRQLDEEDAVLVRVDQLSRHLHAEPGLAGPAGAGQRHQPDVLAAEQPVQGPDLALPPDQRRRLDRQVVRSGIQRDKRWELRRKIGSDDLEDALGSGQILQAVRPEAVQCHLVREVVPHEHGRRLREQNLAAVPDPADPCAAVDRCAVYGGRRAALGV